MRHAYTGTRVDNDLAFREAELIARNILNRPGCLNAAIRRAPHLRRGNSYLILREAFNRIPKGHQWHKPIFATSVTWSVAL